MTAPTAVHATAAIRSWVAASTLDAAADTLFLVGLGWAAAFATGNLSTALILALGTIPRAVLMVAGGALADHWGLALTANATLAVRASLMVPFALVLSSAGGPNGFALAVISLLFGIADGLHVPALGGLVGVLAPGDALRSAQSRATTAGLAAQVVMAPVAGFLVAREGGAVGWVACALLVVASAAMLSLRRRLVGLPLETPEPSDDGMGRRILDGLQYALRSWSVLSLLLVFLMTNLAATAPIAVGIPLKAREFGWAGELYGLATLGFAVGSAVGIFCMERRDPHPQRTMASALVLIGGGAVGSGVLAMATHPLVACLGCLIMGVLFAPAAVLLKTELLRVTPQTHLGRVSGLLGFAIYGGIPIGFAVYGWLASTTSIAAAGLLMTAALVLMVVVMLPQARKAVRS